jgi:hypothetical protein
MAQTLSSDPSSGCTSTERTGPPASAGAICRISSWSIRGVLGCSTCKHRQRGATQFSIRVCGQDTERGSNSMLLHGNPISSSVHDHLEHRLLLTQAHT